MEAGELAFGPCFPISVLSLILEYMQDAAYHHTAYVVLLCIFGDTLAPARRPKTIWEMVGQCKSATSHHGVLPTLLHVQACPRVLVVQQVTSLPELGQGRPNR